MSLSLRKELCVVLCPGKVIVVAFSNLLRRKLVSQAILPLDPETPTDWRPLITALERWLDENEIRKADATIYLSSCFVRFAMMPFADGTTSQAERVAVAGLLLESIYGEAAKHWKLALDEERYGEPCLVGAIDGGLVEAIDELVSSGRLRAAPVLPYAVSVLNAFGKQIDDGGGMVVAIDHGQAVLIDIRGRKITGIRKVMMSAAADGQAIINILRREMLISGLSGETGQVYLHLGGGHKASIPAVSDMNIIVLERANEDDQLVGDYEMACVGEAS